jgi:hypothetical protein
MILQCLSDGSISPAWVAARRGHLGGSQIADMLIGPKGGRAARDKLAMSLAAERLTGYAVNRINPEWPDIARGLAEEPIAIAEYEALRGVWTEPAAWVEHPGIALTGATPDAFIGREGLAQVKSRKIEIWLNEVTRDDIPSDVLCQMDWELACCPWAQWSDYLCYCSEMPEGKRLKVKRRERDNDRIAYLEEEVRKFLAEVEMMFERISTMELN